MLVRMLKFRKRTYAAGLAGCEVSQWWATMGHSDEMESIALAPMALREIKTENDRIYRQDSKQCHHSVVYLIDHEDADDKQDVGDKQAVKVKQATDAELWSPGREFVSVTRIHFPKTTELHDQFQELTEHFGALAQCPEYSGVIWRVYRSIELSDLVLVSKCARFNTLSRWSLLGTDYAKVGRSYTYFCIPNSLFGAGTYDWGNDRIDYLSMRFAIRNNKKALAELTDICARLKGESIFPPSRVAGNEDAVICGRNVPIGDVVELYREWYVKKPGILNVFSDIITRIGAEGMTADKDCPDDIGDDALTEICIKLLEKITDCPAIEEREWRRPLVELGTTLVHMGRSAILDESVYLLLPGLYALWENINSGQLNSEDESLYLRFVELCVHTMEHLMRAEGQLSHHPEVRPIAYDIPVFALECATAFLEELGEELTGPDGEAKRDIAFLLVPGAETDVSTVELFRAGKETRGLLQITVPFSFLYEPTFFPALCHELAHYVGEKCRLRKVRYQKYIAGVARELTHYFFGDSADEGLLNFLADRIADTLRARYKEDQIALPVEEDSLQNIADCVNRYAQVLADPAGYAELVRDYLQEKGSDSVRLMCPDESEMEDGFSRFVRRNTDLRIIYRETYADICMLYFLKLDPEEYLKVALPKGATELKTYGWLRLLISLRTAGHNLDAVLVAVEQFGGEAKARDELQRLDTMLTSSAFSPERYLWEYIQACWQELHANCPGARDGGDSSLLKIYHAMLKDKEQFNYSEILAYIDKNRQTTLGWMQKALGVDTKEQEQ